MYRRVAPAWATKTAVKNLKILVIDMEYRKLKAIAKYPTGKLNSNAAVKNGKYPFFTCAHEVYKIDTYSYEGEYVLLGGNNANGDFPIFYYNGKFDAYQRTYLIQPLSDETDTKYLYYAIGLKLHQMKANASGTATKFLTQPILNNLNIEWRDIEQQQKIAQTLSTYDNLIENNQKRIKLLEQMAENLYKEWFVRFRFPGFEKAEFENGVPKGWEVTKLGEFINLKSGYAFKSDWWIDEGVPVVKIKDIQEGKIDLTSLAYVSEDNAKKAKNFIVNKGDMLIALTGATIGKVGLVTEDNLLVNQRVGKFFVKNPPTRNIGYIHNLFKQDWLQELILMYSGSNAAQPNISPFDIENFKIIYSKEYMDKFNETVYPIYDNILKLYDINANLTQQRNLLLPRLISGKLKV